MDGLKSTLDWCIEKLSQVSFWGTWFRLLTRIRPIDSQHNALHAGGGGAYRKVLMLQRVLCRDSARRLVHQHFLQPSPADG
jgi:hypothetical protein